MDLETLNSEQLEAVTHDTGPLLIIAGAGTGKTHVITQRILYLIQEKKISTDQILALTFTEKATEEMVERVDIALPLGYEELMIKTFHGFSDYILREKGLEIGLPTDYTILTAPDQWLFVKKHLFEFELDYLRPLGNPTKLISALLQHVNRLKDENITPEAYIDYTNSLESTDENQKTLEIAHFYEKYQKLMLENGNLDFQDLTFYTLKLFQKRPHILKEYQNRFQYILVDEFQDTNYAQNLLVELLAKHHQNITVVGDDDQSIYKWRGASLTNILNFEKTFPSVKKIVLTQNYRSIQPILDLAYQVIQNNNPNRLEVQEKIDKKLTARHHKPVESLITVNDTFDQPSKIHGEKSMGKSPWSPPPITTIHTSNYLEEINAVLNEIQKIHDEKQADWSDFAILVRANAHAKPVIEECKRRRLPYQYIGNQGLLSRDEIKDLIAVVRVLCNPNDDIAMFRILTFPIWNLDMEDIMLMLDKARKKLTSLYFMLKNETARPSLIENSDQKTEKIYKLLQNLLESSRKSLVSYILGEFLEKSGYLQNLMNTETLENEERIKNIAQFSEWIRQFETQNEDASVQSFADYINLMDEIGENPQINTPEMIHQDAINIVTIHSAKGLEFPYVFLINLVNERFPTRKKKDPFKIPETLIPEVLPENHHIEEERRLFYVGCTRAEKALHLSWSDYYEGKKKWKKSVFVDEAKISEGGEHSPIEEVERNAVRSGVMARSLEPSLREGRRLINFSRSGSEAKISEGGEHSPIEEVERNAVRRLEKSLLRTILRSSISRLSYSQIDTFETCPHKYKLQYLWKIPTPPSHAANFGSSIHDTLNEFYKILMKSPLKATKETLKTIYEKQWKPYGYISRAHENTRKKKGWEILEAYFEKNRDPWSIPAFLERNFVLRINNFTITGRIDRIDKFDKGYEIIDYKTGKLKKQSDIDKDLQLSIYAIACQNIFNITSTKLSLYFLEDNTKISTTRTPEQLKKTHEDLLGIATNINSSDFKATPGFLCQFCDYRLVCYAV